jgi:hypothetical protein
MMTLEASFTIVMFYSTEAVFLVKCDPFMNEL